MTDAQLSGIWLNAHIRELLEEQRGSSPGLTTPTSTATSTNGTAATTTANASTTASSVNGDAYTTSEYKEGELDQTAQSLRDALTHAEKVVEAARNALMSYVGAVNAKSAKVPEGAQRRGPTSRELSGEMGGDTVVA